jgi:HSP20 family molecular chaperone IbpA
MSMRQMLDRRLQETFSRPRQPAAGRAGQQTLPVDLFETAEEYIVQASLPGASPSDVQVLVEGARLTISGKVKEREGLQDRAAYGQRIGGAFKREVELSQPVDASRVAVKFAGDTLFVTVPKAS